MVRCLWRYSLVILAVALLGCRRRKSDEEMLRERIDVTSVHLYVATRYALTAPESDADARVVRNDLATLVHATQAAVAAINGSHRTDASAPTLAAGDLPRLTLALWQLRSQARRLMREAPEHDVPPVFPSLISARLGVDQSALWTRDTEHAFLLAVFLALKFEERDPVPLPIEMVLYEAWMTRPDHLPAPGLESLAHGMKATVFGLNDLCDLSATEAAHPSLERSASARAATASSLAAITGRDLSLDARELALIDASARAAAHGSASVCFYFSRRDTVRGLSELRRFVEAAHDAGVPPSKTATIRAWIAYEDGDMAAARRALDEARNDPDASPETRRALDELLHDFTVHDDGAVARYYDKAHLTVLVARMVLDTLDRSGAFDGVKNSDIGRTLEGYGVAASRVTTEARRSIPDFNRDIPAPSSLYERARRALGLSR